MHRPASDSLRSLRFPPIPHIRRNLFEGIDADRSGTVTVKELEAVVGEHAHVSAIDFRAFDVDGDGVIDCTPRARPSYASRRPRRITPFDRLLDVGSLPVIGSWIARLADLLLDRHCSLPPFWITPWTSSDKEFVGAALQEHTLHNEENLESIFKRLDTDGSGTLCAKEIAKTLGNDEQLAREILASVGDGDLVMTLSEFKEHMMAKAPIEKKAPRKASAKALAADADAVTQQI